MIIIETCPKCGNDLLDSVIDIMPPIPRKECLYCGWSWEGKPEETIRIPFGGSIQMDTATIRTQRESNDPLTLEELREMDGEPVWVKCLEPGMGHLSCWGIRNSDCVDGYHTNYCDMDYGKGWIAYRRKPSE